MKKANLLEFIKKYSLNDTIEKCRWISSEKDKTLKTSPMTDSRSLLVDVTMSNWDGFGDVEVGIGNTAKFRREISGIYGDDVKFVINYNDDKTRIVNIDVTDDQSVGTFTTSDLDMIPESIKLKKVPPFNAEIIFDEEFKERFLMAKAALPDVESFTVMMNKKKKELELVIGYSNINSSRYSLKVKTKDGKNVVDEPLHFNANYLKEILSANSECGETVLSVSDAGLAQISFVSGDFTSVYSLKTLDDQD